VWFLPISNGRLILKKNNFSMTKVFLNFDFYGAGNIGDDLMLDGFVRGASGQHLELFCSIPRNSSHQEYRFPEIRFVSKLNREDVALQCPVWLGVGDTPVQMRSGEWFLMKLEKDYLVARANRKDCYMIGIGAETEAVSHSDRFRRVFEQVELSWTRDEQSFLTLSNYFDIPKNNLRISSDLANISLKEIFSSQDSGSRRRYDLGICYYDESVDKDNMSELKLFINGLRKNGRNILMFANDANADGMFEFGIYKKMIGPLDRKLSKGLKFLLPPYFEKRSLSSLLEHYRDCSTLMTSRYHALLSAAWAGCKVVALERSSKTSALARDLGIYEIRKPFSSEQLMAAYENAQSVDIERLKELSRKASESILEFGERINKGIKYRVSKEIE
jgi:hypothetical protein